MRTFCSSVSGEHVVERLAVLKSGTFRDILGLLGCFGVGGRRVACARAFFERGTVRSRGYATHGARRPRYGVHARAGMPVIRGAIRLRKSASLPLGVAVRGRARFWGEIAVLVGISRVF